MALRWVQILVEATLPKVAQSRTGAGDAQGEAKAEELPKVTPHRINRDELYEDLAEGSRPNAVYMFTVVLSRLLPPSARAS